MLIHAFMDDCLPDYTSSSSRRPPPAATDLFAGEYSLHKHDGSEVKLQCASFPPSLACLPNDLIYLNANKYWVVANDRTKKRTIPIY
jgi:hypothetical protein